MIKIRHRMSSVLLHVLNVNTLAGADLHCLILSGAYLARAQLRAANLRHVYMRGGDLRESDLREADLTGADLGEADLAGADLRGARYDRYTRWPAGFDAEARGARRVDRHTLRPAARSWRRRR